MQTWSWIPILKTAWENVTGTLHSKLRDAESCQVQHHEPSSQNWVHSDCQRDKSECYWKDLLQEQGFGQNHCARITATMKYFLCCSSLGFNNCFRYAPLITAVKKSTWLCFTLCQLCHSFVICVFSGANALVRGKTWQIWTVRGLSCNLWMKRGILAFKYQWG